MLSLWPQVCSVLESLEREYRRDEDWCSTEKANTSECKVAYMEQLLAKHNDQKEAFLKVTAFYRHSNLCPWYNMQNLLITWFV